MRRALWMTAALILTVVVLPGTAMGQEGTGFVMRPGPGASLAPEGGFFRLQVAPGGAKTQSIALRNDGRKAADVLLTAADAVTGPLGGVSYGLPEDKATKVGKWISLSRTSVHLAPGSSVEVPFTVRVPDSAGPGEHLGGITAYIPIAGKDAPKTEGDVGAAIDVQTRMVLAVMVKTPGRPEPLLEISGVNAAARPDGMYLEIGIDGSGTALTKGTGVIELPDEGFRKEFALDTFVPGTSIAYPIKWRDEVPEGDHSARVEIRYDGRIAVWEGSFSVTGGDVAQLKDRSTSPVSPGIGVPRPLLVASVVLALAYAVALMRRNGRFPARWIPARGSTPVVVMGRPTSAPAGRMPRPVPEHALDIARRTPPPPPPPATRQPLPAHGHVTARPAPPPPPPARTGDTAAGASLR